MHISDKFPTCLTEIKLLSLDQIGPPSPPVFHAASHLYLPRHPTFWCSSHCSPCSGSFHLIPSPPVTSFYVFPSFHLLFSVLSHPVPPPVQIRSWSGAVPLHEFYFSTASLFSFLIFFKSVFPSFYFYSSFTVLVPLMFFLFHSYFPKVIVFLLLFLPFLLLNTRVANISSLFSRVCHPRIAPFNFLLFPSLSIPFLFL